MIHLSARLSWHDSGWNGCVCQAPHLNASCIVTETIRDARDDDKERAHAGCHVADLEGWFPPCSRDILPYSSRGFTLRHSDPLERKFLQPVTESVPAYAVLPAPFRWMREELFRDTCESQALSIPGPENAAKAGGWVYEPYRQRALLNEFWGRVKQGEGKALIFYYVNQGNPVDDNAARLIVGVGRLQSVGPQLYFEGTDTQGEQYPLWTRSVTQDWPAQGFRLPYQEYLQQGYDPREIACYVPPNALLPFSFVAEHVTDDIAVGILERLIQSVERVERDGKVAGAWHHHLLWLNDRLAEVWLGRGPFPGIGSVLQYLGCGRGTAFHRLEMADFVRKGENPWAYVRAILEGRTDPPAKYAKDFQQACQRWSTLGRKPARLELLDTLVRFELTSEQVRRICDPEERAKSGIQASEEELVANPYLICEDDLGSAESDPVDLDSVDRGMLPEGDAALFIPREQIVVHDDTRRVRAVAIAVLKEAANSGDTLLTFSDLLERIRQRFPDKRACKPDREIVMAEADFYRQRLWLALDAAPELAALKPLRDLEQLIAQVIRKRAPRKNADPGTPIDWRAALVREFGEPASERERAALDEKINAFNAIFRQRISVLTGGAGTGKTSALKVFLEQLDRVEGKAAVYLLAPTGKGARPALNQDETKRLHHPPVPAQTKLVPPRRLCPQAGWRRAGQRAHCDH